MICTLVSGPMDPVEYGCLDLSLRLVQPFVECDYSFGVTYTWGHYSPYQSKDVALDFFHVQLEFATQIDNWLMLGLMCICQTLLLIRLDATTPNSTKILCSPRLPLNSTCSQTRYLLILRVALGACLLHEVQPEYKVR